MAGSGNSTEELERVKSLIVKLDSSIRTKIAHDSPISSDEITVENFTKLSGMCGDKIVAVNIKLGTVYYHIYILDEMVDPQVVKVLGPKDVSVKITGFN